jgi:hypothetical protein
MSGFLAAALAYREFWSADQVRELVTRRKEAAERRYASSHGPTVKVDQRDIRLMLLFTTPTQRSWLAVNGLSLFCVLDDLRKEKPTVQWLANRTDAHPVRANYDHSTTSGILHLGTHGRDWLYSKDLFQDRDVVDAVRQFIGDDTT